MSDLGSASQSFKPAAPGEGKRPATTSGKRSSAAVVTFERPPFANEVFTQKSKDGFDKLAGRDRHFVKRLIDHGNFNLAVKEAGIVYEGAPSGNESLSEAILSVGIDASYLALQLKDCIESKVVKLDKNGIPIPDCVDLKIKLSALTLAAKILGYLDTNLPPPPPARSATELFPKDILDEP